MLSKICRINAFSVAGKVKSSRIAKYFYSLSVKVNLPANNAYFSLQYLTTLKTTLQVLKTALLELIS